MKVLLILLVAIFGAVSASNYLGSPCYMCKEFLPNGQGFMEHPNETMCCYYYECWRVDGSTVIDEILRTCPPGTWFNFSPGRRGAPCIANKPYPHCVSECGTSEPITKPMCHLYPNPANAQQFGTLNPPPDGAWEFDGECKANHVFDHSACTCVPVQQESCFCKLDINFVGGIQDDSCHNAHIINSENPVTVQADAAMPDGSAGVFNGSSILSVPMFSGLDSEDCYVGCLSVGVYFKTGDVIGYSSLLETKDCWSGSSYFIETTGGGNVEAFIGSKRASETITTNTWYYVSAVYKHTRNKYKFWFYLMTMAEALECETNCNCPEPDFSDSTLDKNCVSGKSCGVTVGGGSDNPLFFEGLIGRVQISHKCHPMACSGTHCLKKGKRNRF